MKSDYIEFHQDDESIFINKNMIVAIYIQMKISVVQQLNVQASIHILLMKI